MEEPHLWMCKYVQITVLYSFYKSLIKISTKLYLCHGRNPFLNELKMLSIYIRKTYYYAYSFENSIIGNNDILHVY